MDELANSVTKFRAKFKSINAKSRDKFATLEFEVAPELMPNVAGVLVVYDRPVVLWLGELFMDAKLKSFRVDGGGRSWVRFLVDLTRAAETFPLVDTEVEVKVR